MYMYIFRFVCFDYPDASDLTEDVRRSRDIYYKYMVLSVIISSLFSPLTQT